MAPMQIIFSALMLIVLLASTGQCSDYANPNWPPGLTANQFTSLATAFQDAITLARTIALIFNCESDMYFTRYFAPKDAIFVRNIFRTIANIPLDYDSSNLNLNQVQAFITARGGDNLPDALGQVSIYYGDNPDALGPDDGWNNPSCDGAGTLYGWSNWVTETPNLYFISICPAVFQTFYSFRQILQGTAGLGGSSPCDGLGDRESNYMESPGVTVLHEMLHMPLFYANVPEWADEIRKNKDGDPQIQDYRPDDTIDDPPDGIGAFRAQQVRNLLSEDGYSEALNNVDNYVWFATTKFWSWRCQRDFGPPLSEEDFYRRDIGANNGIEPQPPVKVESTMWKLATGKDWGAVFKNVWN